MIDVTLGLRLIGDRLRRFAGRLVNKAALWFLRREVSPAVLLEDAPLFRFREDCLLFQQLAWCGDKAGVDEFVSRLWGRKTMAIRKAPAIVYVCPDENPGADTMPTGPRCVRLHDFPTAKMWTPAMFIYSPREG